MKNKFLGFLFLTFIGFCSTITAQQIEIKGTVSDYTGEPLPGATVQIKGTTRGVSTDFDGNYSIKVSKGETIVYSFIGFIKEEVIVGNQTDISLRLSPDTTALDEIVIGYGSVKKKDFTGAVTALTEKDFNSGPIIGVENLIQGRAAGVQVSAASSEPGGEMLVRIRGNNSVNSNNGPLYVVDGFPLDFLDNSINPADIASVNILKDASATAIYGTRGANGVVIITTKRGKDGQANIKYSVSYSINEADISAYNFLDSNDFAAIQNGIDVRNNTQPTYSQDAINRIDALGLQTNWLDEAFRTGTTNEHQISVTGGNQNTKAFFSVGAYLWDGVVKNTSFDRYNLRLNVDQNLIGGKLKSGVNVSLSSTETNFMGFAGNALGDNILRNIFRASPIVPTTEIWNTLSDNDKQIIFKNNKPSNPLQTLEIADNKSTNYFILTNAFLELTIAKDFKFKTNAGVRVTNQKIRRFLPADSNLISSSLEPGAATLNHGLFTYYTFENTLHYDKVFNKHSINVLIGTTTEWSDNESFTAGAKDFTSDALGYNNLQAGATPLTPVSEVSESKLISYLARANYTYDDRYLLTLTYRRDGSSKFGRSNKWGNFPSIAAAWNVHNESFVGNKFIFSRLKFRGSYGITGSDRFGVGQGQSAFSPTAPVTFDGSELFMGTISSRVGNSDLQWEETHKADLGIEMGFFNNRLNVEIGAYRNNTKKLLLAKGLAPSFGVSSILTNAGEIQNQGIELSVDYTYYSKSDFHWYTNFSLGYNDNEIKELVLPEGATFLPGPEARIDGEIFGYYSILREGLPINAIYGYKFIGILQPGQVYAPQPNAIPGEALFEDINGDGVIDSQDKKVLGNGYPKYSLGFNNSFSYKNFTVSLFFTGMFGIDKINGNNLVGYKYNTLTLAKERWTPDNMSGTLPQNNWVGDQWINNHNVESGSFVKMKNITFSYSFSPETLSKSGLSSLELYLTGTNLLTWDSYSGFDPEVNAKRSGGTNLNVAAGLDAYSYPSQKSYSLGLKIGI
ncbi:TonB-dependent receptor [Gelidibacter japonicus]|uniref:SusC/RagA family TonB-linked outer membrane protein n=1 Tax=Gelidibacter japonicus TaxID=1962232 RepID=UPI0020201DA4|nr:TonB-dependent receptor [Gelidibacter japonicus]MCL8006950.1 TonB-dependent receptor [Gelidibacter japonicus]